MKKMVFLFPGQGSQYAGMGRDFHQRYPVVRELFERASDELGMDFANLCFEAPAPLLAQTENAQPAVTLVNIACLEVLKEQGILPSAASGHSLGEYAALFAAGVLDFSGVMKLVKSRGSFMKEAAEKHPGGMIAIMGLDAGKIERICGEVKTAGQAQIANLNSPKQIIVSGEMAALQRVSELAGAEGAKLIIPLKVSGPWHSSMMVEAGARLEKELTNFALRTPSLPVVANSTAEYLGAPDQIAANLVRQLSSPVLWWNSMDRFIRDGYTCFVEVGPNRVLRGLMRDINRDVTALNVEDVKSLEKLLEAQKTVS